MVRTVDELEGIKLVLVVAPAGYGKTTLMVDWARRLQDQAVPTGWVTLDQNDDDPDRIVSHIRSAFARTDEAAKTNGRGESGVRSLKHSDVTFSPKRGVVFLDDFEVISSERAHKAVRLIIEQLPPAKSLVIGSRSLPQIGLGRLRLDGELREVRSEDLRFDRDETGRLLRELHGVHLSEASIDALCRHTEGWVAGLRLTGLALKGRADADSFVRGLSHPQIELAQYLAESVLAQQSDDVRCFLLETSILPKLTGPLCEALTGKFNGYQMLDHVERSNLFLTALDEGRQWFRYHPLFADFLRTQLERQDPGRVVELHRAAARWFHDHGLPLEAVDHALSTGDQEFAASLLDGCAMESVKRGRISALIRWVKPIPFEILDAHPRIRMAAAWACLFQRDLANARALVAAVEQGQERHRLDARLRDDLLTFEVLLALTEDRMVDMMNLARENLGKLSCDGTWEHGVLSNLLGLGLATSNRFDEAPTFFVQGRASHHRAGSTYGEAYSIAFAGLSEAAQGRPKEALRTYRTIDELKDESGGPGHSRAVVATLLADVLYEFNRLEEAEQWVNYSLPVADDFAWATDLNGSNHLTLARIRFAQGRVDDAARILEAGELEGTLRRFPRIVAALRWERVRMALRSGDIRDATERARAIEQEFGQAERSDFYHYISECEARNITGIRLAIRAREAKPALAQINSEIAKAEERRRGWRWLKLMLLKSQALEQIGDRKQALRILRDALKRAAPEGFLRSFADEGGSLPALLTEIRSEAAKNPWCSVDISVSYLDQILAASGVCTTVAIDNTPASADMQPLSERELELLVLAAEGFPNRALARRLFVSENTIKTHLRNIYHKLGVSSRTAAVATARRQAIIS